MAMMRKTITISDAMADWVKAQIESGRYANDSEYFRDLIRRDQDRRAPAREMCAAADVSCSGAPSPHVRDLT